MIIYNFVKCIPWEILQPWLLIAAAQRYFDSLSNRNLLFQIEAQNTDSSSMMWPPTKSEELWDNHSK